LPEIHSEILVSAPPARVYSLAKEVERLPEFLPNLEKVIVHSREGDRTVSEWVAFVPEFKRKISWVEDDIWDDDELACTFRATSGDWTQYQGTWCFRAQGEGTLVTLDISYEYNVPLIGPLIKKLLHKLMARNTDETLQGLRRRVQETD
jgi:ribosome-associated toxin RatA of RatAB toxin-antitoxin module